METWEADIWYLLIPVIIGITWSNPIMQLKKEDILWKDQPFGNFMDVTKNLRWDQLSQLNSLWVKVFLNLFVM